VMNDYDIERLNCSYLMHSETMMSVPYRMELHTIPQTSIPSTWTSRLYTHVWPLQTGCAALDVSGELALGIQRKLNGETLRLGKYDNSRRNPALIMVSCPTCVDRVHGPFQRGRKFMCRCERQTFEVKGL
jgi:hypothetical protein